MNHSQDFLLDYRSTDHFAVLFWDKPLDADNTAVYYISYDGNSYSSNRTHFTMEDLSPETAYYVEISYSNGDKSSHNPVHLIGNIEVITEKKKRKIDVTKAPYNAVGDGLTVNTKAIQQALNDCKPDEKVYFPKGLYMTGALDVHSDTEIYVDEGAYLQGTTDPTDYLPQIHSRFEGYERECYRSLLNIGTLDHTKGATTQNIIIRGKGTIYGGGWELAKAEAKTEAERLKDYIASLGDKINDYEKPETIANRVRGRLFNISNTENVWIHGITLGFAPSWNVHFIYSDNVVTDHCTFRSTGVWNGDGWDPDSSTNSTLFACTFYTEDDSVAIKSGKNPEGNEINRPTKHIRVFDSVCKLGHGLCIGSEMSGGVEDVRLWDNDMGPTWSGIEVKGTKKRGGYVRGIEVRDCIASHIMIHSVGYNDDGIGSPVPPIFEDCHYERLHLLGRYLDNNAGRNTWQDCPAIELRGFDVPGYELKNVSFKDIEMENHADGVGSIDMQFCEGVTFENMKSVPATPTKKVIEFS